MFSRTFNNPVHKLLLLLSIVAALWECTSSGLHAQELKAKVSINSEKLGSANREMFSDLEKQLTDLINQNKWSGTTFAPQERIECSFSLNLLSMTDNGEYTAELYVTAQRPVYGTSYNSPLFLYRDQELNFSYQPYTPIQFNPNDLDNNLVAGVVFYVYFILAVDFDSFSELGGNMFRNEMRQLANAAMQKADWKGWQPFESDYNRYAIAEIFHDPSHDAFRRFWYQYHRLGLDEAANNIRRGYTNICDALPMLEDTWKEKSTSPLLRMFSEAKLDELTQLLQEAPKEKKLEVHKLLKKLFPTEENKYSALTR